MLSPVEAFLGFFSRIIITGQQIARFPVEQRRAQTRDTSKIYDMVDTEVRG